MVKDSSIVLGIMSGTSIDSVDYALCDIGERDLELLRHWQARFPPALRRRLHEAARGAAGSHEVAQVHHDLGRFYARQAGRFAAREKPELVGLHGQTIFHSPNARAPATFQLGEPAYLAEKLRVPVVSNFRAADMAAGGQGAPLATIFHERVFGRKGEHICVNNLGGISNVTSIDWTRGDAPQIMAFDTGPANVLLDLAMRSLTGGKRQSDWNGAWAARGRPSDALLSEWLRHAYFRRKPPKSTGRELFGEPLWNKALPQMRRAVLSKFDMLATFTEFTARSMALNYRLHLPSMPRTIILTGGGAANGALVASIRGAFAQLGKISLVSSEALGWPTQSIEPAAFALLGWLRARSQPGNLPQTSGASRAVRLGQISEA
jgi:anhydro-N-acetylmuramic acid kinase